ncbi:MAG TPA: MerR family transcriptional regulator, partial [Actinobacteria bacterium]|nr:MerR family transcriptional regulator [Actinomycetes bacterium]HEX21765.1 MerR family transcriptional regulator [Actinomycetota bacterium]
KKAGRCGIGEAVKRLRPKNPSISISKIRYLEDEGLLSVARTKGGYRQFSENDLARLEEILRLQRDYFLPLQVIKKKMVDWTPNQEKDPDRLKGELSKDAANAGQEAPVQPIELEEALKRVGLKMDDVKSLANYSLLNIDETVDGKALSPVNYQIIKVYRALKGFGIEARHLRIYENFSNKEINLVRQILAPHLRHNSKKKREQSKKELNKLVGLTDKLQQLLRERAIEQLKLN